MNDIKILLDNEVLNRNKIEELSVDKPDPLMVLKRYNCEYIGLICALFAYGNAKQIVKFLKKLPLDLIGKNNTETELRIALNGLKYRFQSNEDIVQWFLLIEKIKSLKINFKDVFLKEYYKNNDVIESIESTIVFLKENIDYESRGINFLIGTKGSKSPYKRWNMFLRWMTRDDNLDLGRWKEIQTKDLLIPLDTHTFKLGKEFGLITRKSYNLKAAIELTESLKRFDSNDPVKYDFAIYRLGQEKN